jgi:hypothetical protein
MNNTILNKQATSNKSKVTIIKTKGRIETAAPETSGVQSNAKNRDRKIPSIKVWASPSFFFNY